MASNDTQGWYYLHENGDVIYKRFEPEEEAGGFVKKVWRVDLTNRSNAWTIVLEALGLGCNVERAKALCAKWSLTQEDFVQFAARNKHTKLLGDGLLRMVTEVWGLERIGAFHGVMDKLATALDAENAKPERNPCDKYCARYGHGEHSSEEDTRVDCDCGNNPDLKGDPNGSF